MKFRLVEQRVMEMSFDDAINDCRELEVIFKQSLNLKIQARLQFDSLCQMSMQDATPHQLKKRWELMQDLIKTIQSV